MMRSSRRVPQLTMALAVGLVVVSSCRGPLGRMPAARMQIGGADLTLGMQQDAALMELRSRGCSVGEKGGLWWVNSGQPSTRIGIVSFSDGKLATLSRDWPLDDDATAQDVTEALYRLLAELQAGTNEPLRVTLGTFSQPDLSCQHITFASGQRSASLKLYRDRAEMGKPEYRVELEEQLSR